MSTNYPALGFTDASATIAAFIQANQPVLLVGSPGIGKTALMRDLAAYLDLSLVTIIASICDPTDIGGFPVVRQDGAFDRVPMRAIRRAADEPVLLFFDELSCAPPQVQAALLQGVYSREFGDATLHEGTRIVAAMNPPDQAPGGYEVAAPLVGRFSIFDFEPSLDEVRGYFYSLGDEGSRLRSCALDFAATSEREVSLIAMHPPQAAIVDGAKWPSPRDWERALRAWAELPEDADQRTVSLVLGGSLGQQAADAFIGIRKLRESLPTVSQIAKDPAKAKVPTDVSVQIAALGLLANVARRDYWAAWVYCERLADEVGAALCRSLMKLAKHKSSSPAKHEKAGHKAMQNLLGRVGNALG